MFTQITCFNFICICEMILVLCCWLSYLNRMDLCSLLCQRFFLFWFLRFFFLTLFLIIICFLISFMDYCLIFNTSANRLDLIWFILKSWFQSNLFCYRILITSCCLFYNLDWLLFFWLNSLNFLNIRLNCKKLNRTNISSWYIYITC